MPAGQGYLPSGALYNKLSYITRHAYLPYAVSQIYNASPTACGLLSNAEQEAGGVDSFIVNVQTAQLVQAQMTSFQGNFSAPTALQGITPASWSMTMGVVPIPIFITELAIQSQQKIQDILSLRFTDAGNAVRDMVANQIFVWTSSTSATQIVGLPGAIDDGTVNATYGGINRSTTTAWQAKRYAAGSVNPTRALVSQYINGVAKAQGEVPTFGVMGFGTWTLLQQDFLPLERYSPNADSTEDYLSSFRALEVEGVPIYADAYCPEGIMYLINTNYLSFRIHQDANWEFLDFTPLTPSNQLGYIGVVYIIFTLVLTKPKTCAVVSGFNYATI